MQTHRLREAVKRHMFRRTDHEHTNMFLPKAGRGSSSFSAQPSMQTGSQACSDTSSVTILTEDSRSNGKKENSVVLSVAQVG